VRKIIIAAVSVNGFLSHSETEGANWTSKADKRFFKEATCGGTGVVIVGRKTYETIPNGLPGRRMIVLTRHPERFQDGPEVEFRSEGAQTLLPELEANGVKECWIAGGRQVYTYFLREGLVDEIFLTIEPILFGNGIPFLSELAEDRPLSLVSHRLLNDQTVLLHYRTHRTGG
jgi:dihydrofolate reductase